MTQIDKTKSVLVTGANGYVASWLVKRLLEEGYTVHAAVRNPRNKEKIGHLRDLAKNSKGAIKFFKANLLEEDSYAEAMHGCELVYHTASPFATNVEDPQKELVEPAEKGTENVLLTANTIPSVKRVVVTSSCAAMHTDSTDTLNTPKGMLTEEVWNTTSSLEYQPYFYSKTLAEKKAWEIANAQDQWDLVTINPSFVMGPFLNPAQTTSESITFLKQLGSGAMKNGVPKFGVGLVDVRDVAEAHLQAGMNPRASGRYITSAHDTNFFEMAMALLDRYGNDYPLPKKASPKWLVVLLGPIIDSTFNRRTLRNNVNVAWRADNSKIKSELGIKFRPLTETMEDSFECLVKNGMV